MSRRPILARLILWRGNAPVITAILAGIILARFAPLWHTWAILLVGLAAGVLIAASFALNSKHTGQVESLVAQLMRVNHKLNAEIQQRAHIEKELEVARDEALELSRLKSQFLANMSHEIRTPMNGVLGMTELLLDTPLTEDQREYADAVRKSGENLMLIINDILDFAQIEAGAMRIQRQEFGPGAIVKGAIDLLRSRAEAKGLSLTQELSTELPDVVAGDPARLRQMLVILIGNAIKFTERGEVFVEVAPAAWTEASVTLRISVHDTGIGIAPERQARLFESFYQGDGSNTRRYGGAGLGLAICKQLAEKMGGGIEVESQLGRGSTFRLTVRLEVPAEDPSRGPTYFGWTEKPANVTKPERALPVTQVGQK